jgi:hypothetical protein
MVIDDGWLIVLDLNNDGGIFYLCCAGDCDSCSLDQLYMEHLNSLVRKCYGWSVTFLDDTTIYFPLY